MFDLDIKTFKIFKTIPLFLITTAIFSSTFGLAKTRFNGDMELTEFFRKVAYVTLKVNPVGTNTEPIGLPLELQILTPLPEFKSFTSLACKLDPFENKGVEQSRNFGGPVSPAQYLQRDGKPWSHLNVMTPVAAAGQIKDGKGKSFPNIFEIELENPSKQKVTLSCRYDNPLETVKLKEILEAFQNKGISLTFSDSAPTPAQENEPGTETTEPSHSKGKRKVGNQ